MSVKEQIIGEKSKTACDHVVYRRDAPCVAIIAEDLRLLLDAGGHRKEGVLSYIQLWGIGFKYLRG